MLASANIRYWTGVAPLVRLQMRRWEQAARTISDPGLRALALGKLTRERFNPQLAATLATPAPRRERDRVVEAIVALQVLYDYLDAVDEHRAQERSTGTPLPEEQPGAGRRLFAALTDAITLDAQPADSHYADARSNDGGYPRALVAVVRSALARLPGASATAEATRIAACRCGEAQVLHHAAPELGTAPVRAWAARQAGGAPRPADGTELGWQEFLAGACASVLGLHALIAAAARPETTHADAAAIDAAYLSIGALTMLDSIVDREQDRMAGQTEYLQYYEDPEVLSERLAWIARDALARTRTLPHAAHHAMTVLGIVAYYLSAPGADNDLARTVTAPLRAELRPALAPTLALMRAWRAVENHRTPGPVLSVTATSYDRSTR
ncbi:MAG TPA: DUF2600 family protein, partial [Solirubrobacteraceae bacterium]|nr:DUF2600 family protein [Solirubrobacteraceae bacterium]